MKKITMFVYCVVVSIGSVGQQHAPTHSPLALRDNSTAPLLFDSASSAVYDSLKLLIKNEKKDTARAMHLNRLSYVTHEDKPDTAMLLAMEALEIAQNGHHRQLEAYSWIALGNVYQAIGNLSKAMDAQMKAMKICEEIGDSHGLSSSLNNLAIIYFSRKDYVTALPLLQKSIELKKATGDAIPMGNIADAYAELGKYDSALRYATDAYLAAEKAANRRQIAHALVSLGSLYYKKNKSPIAVEYYRESISHAIFSNSITTLAAALMGLATVHRAENQMDSAIYYARTAFQICQKRSFLQAISETSNFMYSIYKETGNIDSAFRYLEIAKVASDSMFNQQGIRRMQTLEREESFRQKEVAANEQAVRTEREKNLQYGALAIGIISAIILFFALSRTIIVKERFIKFSGILVLLIAFEFISLFIHPYIGSWTHHSPLWMLLILVSIAALVIPLHHRLEKWVTGMLIEKNRRIRLAAAKKTIATFEGATLKNPEG